MYNDEMKIKIGCTITNIFYDCKPSTYFFNSTYKYTTKKFLVTPWFTVKTVKQACLLKQLNYYLTQNFQLCMSEKLGRNPD